MGDHVPSFAVDSVDGYSSYKSRQRSSSSVAVGNRSGESMSAGVVYDRGGGGVFKTPEPVDKPRYVRIIYLSKFDFLSKFRLRDPNSRKFFFLDK